MDAELDRILDAGFLGGLGELSVPELRSRREQCQRLEPRLSYLRRLVQGRNDIVTSEIDRLAKGGDPTDVRLWRASGCSRDASKRSRQLGF